MTLASHKWHWKSTDPIRITCKTGCEIYTFTTIEKPKMTCILMCLWSLVLWKIYKLITHLAWRNNSRASFQFCSSMLTLPFIKEAYACSIIKTQQSLIWWANITEFIIRLSMIIRLNIVLNTTVTAVNY